MRIPPSELRERYIERGESSEQIAAALGVTGRAVRYWLGKIGLSEAMKERKGLVNRGRKPGNFGRLSDAPALGRRYVNRDGRCMPYARWLMEAQLGRRLRSDEHVHHIDGDPLHDVIENLTVISAAEHCRHHNPVASRRDRRGKRSKR